MGSTPNKGQRQPGGSKMETPPPENRPKGIILPGMLVGGNYEVLDQVGEGGMAVVYRARQKSLNRIVAIKALHPKYAQDTSFVERFEAESGALASLSHPNIVTIIDRGIEEESYYFIMEYVDGEDLDKKIIKNTVRRTNDWRQVISACSEALEYVHKRGVVHRDIKPSNILVSQDGQIKLGDFGIAHIIQGDQQPGSQGNRPIGTQYYMAPEQTTDPGSVDHRADIYSLGVALYKMMTRQLPSGEFAAPSEVNQDIPTAVDAIIFQALAPNREDRYRSAKEFCDDLLMALRDQSRSISRLFNYRQAGSGSLYTGDDFRAAALGAKDEDSKDKKTGSDSGTRKGGAEKKSRPPLSAKTGSRSGTGSRKSKGILGASKLKEDSASSSSSFGWGLPRPKAKAAEEPKKPAKQPSGTGSRQPSGSGTGSRPGSRGAASTDKTSTHSGQIVIRQNDEVEEVKPAARKSNLMVVALVAVVAVVVLAVGVGVIIILSSNEPTRRPPRPADGPVQPITGAKSPAQEREEAFREMQEQREAELMGTAKDEPAAEATPTQQSP